MNLIYETNGEEEAVERKKYLGLIIAIIVAFVLTVGIGIWLLVAIKKEESMQLKITIDGNRISDFSENFIYKDDKNTYISIKELAQIMKYSVYNGGYKEYTEEQNRCYIESEDEIVDFTSNSNQFAKIEKNRDGEKYKYFEVEQKILQINDNMYISPDGAEIAFNIDVTQEGSKINIFSLDYFVEYYSQQYENIVANDIYDKKPILYGEMIVRDEQGRLGINDLKNKSIVGAKYSNIQFDEETKEYYVTTTENQIGLINLQGNIIISPQYDEINRISKDMDLYVVKKNDKYGIINEKNEIVVYIELDQIGLDSYDSYGEVKNKYLLYDSVIPVMYNEKWGLVDKKGEVVIPLEYDSFGTAGTKKEKDQYPVLLIEDYKSLIVQKDEYYGILNYKGETLIPCALTDVYYKISSGKKVYNMTYLENTMDVLDYLKEKYIKENANQKDVEEVTEEDYDEEW